MGSDGVHEELEHACGAIVRVYADTSDETREPIDETVDHKLPPDET